MIDYPAMIIPVNSAVDPVLDPVDKDFKPANEKDAAIQAHCKLQICFDVCTKMLTLSIRFARRIRGRTHFGPACMSTIQRRGVYWTSRCDHGCP